MSTSETISANQYSPDKITQLLSAGEVAKIKLYHSILEKIAAGETPTPSELKAFSTLHQEIKTGQLSDSQESEMTFKNVLAVLQYLVNAGYKISQPQLYRHVNNGKLRPRKDGQFAQKDVDKFAVMFLKRLGGTGNFSQNNDDLDNLQKTKLEEEVKKLKAQRVHWEKRNQDIDTELETLLDQHLSQQAIVLKADLKNLSYAKAPVIVDLVRGNPEKTVDLINFLLQEFTAALSRYTKEAT